MEWLVLAFAALLIVAFILKGKSTAEDEAAYIRRERLFTPAERSFYGVLKQACGDDAVVFGKVRVADVLAPAKGQDRSGWQKAFNRISAKHFDYVICKPDDLSVIAVIELDDDSHRKRSRTDRDAFLQGACESAGLKLHKFDAKHAYPLAAVREELFPGPSPARKTEAAKRPATQEHKESAGTIVVEKVSASTDTPHCPKCGSDLIKRVARKGSRQGQEFLGCSAFPSCRYTKKADA